MKRFCQTLLLLSGLFLTSVCPAQVRFDAGFESGAFGSACLLDSVSVVVAPGDTVPHLSFLIEGKYDPENPIDTTLEPSANWYYFRMTGVKGKQIYLTQKDNGVARTSYSYDGKVWGHRSGAGSTSVSRTIRFTSPCISLTPTAICRNASRPGPRGPT